MVVTREELDGKLLKNASSWQNLKFLTGDVYVPPAFWGLSLLGVKPFSATRRWKRHQNEFKVEGFGLNISYLA